VQRRAEQMPPFATSVLLPPSLTHCHYHVTCSVPFLSFPGLLPDKHYQLSAQSETPSSITPSNHSSMIHPGRRTPSNRAVLFRDPAPNLPNNQAICTPS